LCFGLLLRLILAWLPEEYFLYLVYDDAYYYYSVARNLVTRGMLSADGLTQTNGFHPLWLFVVTPIYFFFHSHHWFSIHLVLTLSAIFDTAAALLIYKSLERLEKANLGFWATAFYLVNPYSLQHTMDGLEIAQNNFFLALLVYLSLKATPAWLKSNWFSFGAVLGLTLLSRTDNVLIVGVLLGYLLWYRRDFIPLVKTVATASLLVLPWLVYNYVHFGSIIQTSGTAYPWHYRQQYLSLYGTYFSLPLLTHLLKSAFFTFAQNSYHYGSWLFTLALGGILLFYVKQSPERFRPFFWTVAASALFAAFHILLRWSVRPWYLQSAFVLTLPIVALALEKINWKLVAAGAFLTLVLAGLQVWSPVFNQKIKNMRRMADVINREIPPGDRVGAFNSGLWQYLSDRKVINLDGLVNNEVLAYYQQKRGLEYLRFRDIKWLVDFPLFFTRIFGPYLGAEADRSLAYVAEVSDPYRPLNSVWLLAVLPDSLRPPADRVIPINREPAVPSYGPVPIPFIRKRP